MDLKVICLQTDAFYSLIDEVVSRIQDKQGAAPKKWLTTDEAMERLCIKSKTTMQKFRDEGKIRFTQPEHKIVLYYADSINAFIEKHSHETFDY